MNTVRDTSARVIVQSRHIANVHLHVTTWKPLVWATSLAALVAMVSVVAADDVRRSGPGTWSLVAGRWTEEAPLENGQTWLAIGTDGQVRLSGPNPCTGQLVDRRSPTTYRLVLDCGDGLEDRELHLDQNEHLRLVWTATEADDYVRRD